MPPIYLLNAIQAVERVLRTHAEERAAVGHDEGMTAAAIAEQLRGEGYRWPLRRTNGPGYDGRQPKGEPTPERVRRVCKLRGNATRIGRVPGSTPPRYRIDPLLGPRR